MSMAQRQRSPLVNYITVVEIVTTKVKNVSKYRMVMFLQVGLSGIGILYAVWYFSCNCSMKSLKTSFSQHLNIINLALSFRYTFCPRKLIMLL